MIPYIAAPWILWALSHGQNIWINLINPPKKQAPPVAPPRGDDATCAVHIPKHGGFIMENRAWYHFNRILTVMELTGFTIQVPIVIKMGYGTSVVL